MTQKVSAPRFDVASAMDRGNRDYQEDSLISDFTLGNDWGVIVLADGMGGHSAGDLASKIVVTEIYSALKFNGDLFLDRLKDLPPVMTHAIDSANECIRATAEEDTDTRGMGSTALAVVMAANQMMWASVGDSPLFHYRAGRMIRVNEDHSMAPQIDAMAAAGLLSADEAAHHPDRNCLISAVMGEPIEMVDNRGIALDLKVGDIVVASSDGIQFLEDATIVKTIERNRRKPSAEIARALLQAVKTLDHPEQDNISFVVVKVQHDQPTVGPIGNAAETAVANDEELSAREGAARNDQHFSVDLLLDVEKSENEE